MNTNEILLKAIEQFGAESQMKMVVEECAELIQAVNKYERAVGLDAIQQRYNNLSEEIADVEIMLQQAKLILKNADLVEMVKEQKIKRLSDKLTNFQTT